MIILDILKKKDTILTDKLYQTVAHFLLMIFGFFNEIFIKTVFCKISLPPSTTLRLQYLFLLFCGKNKQFWKLLLQHFSVSLHVLKTKCWDVIFAFKSFTFFYFISWVIRYLVSNLFMVAWESLSKLCVGFYNTNIAQLTFAIKSIFSGTILFLIFMVKLRFISFSLLLGSLILARKTAFIQ